VKVYGHRKKQELSNCPDMADRGVAGAENKSGPEFKTLNE